MTIPEKKILSFFGHFQVTSPYVDPVSCFDRFVHKVLDFCFPDSYAQKTTHQSGGSCNAKIDSQLLFKVFKKINIFIPANKHKIIL